MNKRISFPGSRQFLSSRFSQEKPTSLQFSEIFETSINVLEMSLQIFIAATIRCYENVILDEPDNYKKKVKYMKGIIRDRFTAPSLGTLLDLARHCFHLINNDISTPDELLTMKECLNKSLTLGPIGSMFSDIENIIDRLKEHDKVGSAKTIYTSETKQQVLKTFLPTFVEYRNYFKHSRELGLILEEELDTLKLDIKKWQLSLDLLLDTLSPILNHTFIHKTVSSLQRNYDGLVENREEGIQFIVDVKTYIGDNIHQSKENISYRDYLDLDEFQGHEKDLLLIKEQDSSFGIDIFPFLVIQDDKLYFYKRTKAKGYEYYSLSDNSLITIATKRKFNHALFNREGIAGDQQSIFWTEVLPVTNPRNKIKANIPTEGLVDFVGRKRQRTRITEETIEIPNQNGIIYGPGGVGKTALMIQISKDLFEELDPERIFFKNIIWVTAKENYFNPQLGKVEEKDKQFESLDTIFSVLLRFFNYENIDEYDFADKTKLVLELLEENSILLILDNFETITKREAERILDFFGLEVKKRLRKSPELFKLIVTSREQIPCAFHPISLEGLDLRDSKQLMKKLFELYMNTKTELSDEQKRKLHEVTYGIPILIKHCFGQIYEYNKPFESVLNGLSKAESEVIKFSFSEIIGLLQKDQDQLKTLILLEVHDQPLSIRQIADILEVEQSDLVNKIPSLVNFQCLEKLNQGVEEKYFVNEKVHLFTKGLVKDNFELAELLRKRFIRKLSLEKQMDYSQDEADIISIFENYISEQRYLEAEDFIRKQLEKNYKSILLRYHYAKYHKEEKQDIDGAIDILEDICKSGYQHANIYRLLISCFVSLDIPNYNGAKIYVNKLRDIAIDDDNAKLEVAEFYTRWSTSIKVSARALDPIKELERKGKYKDLATHALGVLNKVSNENKYARFYYIAAQSHFNLWDNKNALNMINKALSFIDENSPENSSFMRVKRAILKKLIPPKNFRRF